MNKKILGFLLLFLMATLTVFAQDADKGKKIFKDNCAACHNKNMKDKSVGPALGGVQERWADYPKEDLYKWIRNSTALVESGHKKAKEVFDEYKIPMTPFPNLKDEEIADMLAYIDAVHKGTYGKKAGGGGAAAGGGLPADFDQGKKLFKDNCAACHNKNMKDKAVGPALGGVQERWADYPKEDLYKWVRNSSALVDSGHKKAKEVFDEYKIPMTPFPNLKDDEIGAIFSYVDAVYKGQDKKQAEVKTTGTETPGKVDVPPTSRSPWPYVILFGILALLAAFLWHRGTKLEYDAAIARGEKPLGKPKSFLGTLFGQPVLGFIIFALSVGLTFIAAEYSVAFGRQNGYQPDQPIKFSHKTHAGDNKIDCQFCHDGARRSRHSNVPEGSTCIKCHAAITKGSTYGTAELTKIYASLGWDPSTGKYIPNYNNLSEDQIKGIFTKWIRSKNSDAKDLDNLVNTQWEGIKSSLTNPTKPQIQGPVEWVRVHALPDHVYFNHSQHVNVGGLECQQCHGKVQEMDVLRQVSPLSMGWCVNCHRQTPVKFKDNKYYQEQFPWHKKQMEDGTITKVTVGDLGGLECQKCHY